MDGRPRFGKPETRWSGGSALGQRAATIMEYETVGKEKLGGGDVLTWVRIAARKSSNGTGTRWLKACFNAGRFLLGPDGDFVRDEEGEKIRVVDWDWRRATVDVLSRCFNADHAPEYERLGDAEARKQVRMTQSGAGERRVYTLRGFDERDERRQLWSLDGLDAQELAAAVEESREVQHSLQECILSQVMRHTVYVHSPDDDAKKEFQNGDQQENDHGQGDAESPGQESGGAGEGSEEGG
jgi:uncharacterized membrane protein